MTLILRGEIAEARERTATADEITYSRAFLVLTDNDHTSAREVSFCPGLPFLGYSYVTPTETDPLVRCIKRTAKPVANHRRLWEVRVDYSSKHDDPEKENNEEEEIELEPPDVRFSHAIRMKAIQGSANLVDSYGNAAFNGFGGVTTSAGEPFDPPAEEEEHYPVLTISRNEIIIPVNLTNYVNSVNRDVFQGAAPRQVKMAGIDAVKIYNKGLRYYRVTYVMEFNRDTWDLQLLDIGSFYLEAGPNGTTLRKKFLTDDDNPQPRLGLLNGFGVPLDDGGVPQFRRFRRRGEMPFNALQLEGAINA